MDLNELLYHHQLAIMNAPPCSTPAKSRADLVRHYAGRIHAFRHSRGLDEYRSGAQAANIALNVRGSC